MIATDELIEKTGKAGDPTSAIDIDDDVKQDEKDIGISRLELKRQLTPPLLPMKEMIPTQYFGANIPAKIKYGFEAVIERADFEQAKRNKLNQKIMFLDRLFER